MSRPLRPLPLRAATAALALLVCVVLRHRQIQVQQEQPFGRCTARQVIERTLPLCRTLQPEAGHVTLSAEPVRTLEPRGRMGRYWWVSCIDTDGAYLAEFTWNADTGELVRVGHRFPQVSASQQAASPSPWTGERAKARAARLSYRWLCRLGMAQAASRCRLLGTSSAGGDAWTSQWRVDERSVMVNVNLVSGALGYAQRSRPSDAAPGDVRGEMAPSD
jgi:hypothetical protein